MFEHHKTEKELPVSLNANRHMINMKNYKTNSIEPASKLTSSIVTFQ